MARTIIDPDESTVLDGDDDDNDDAAGGGGSELERRKKSSSTPGKHRQRRERRLRGGNDEAPGEPQASSTPPAEPAQEQDSKIVAGQAADGVSMAPTAAAGGVAEPSLAATSMATKANADRDGGSEEDLDSTVAVSTILECGAKGASTGDPKVDQLFRATLASLRSAITGLKDKNDACESQIKVLNSNDNNGDREDDYEDEDDRRAESARDVLRGYYYLKYNHLPSRSSVNFLLNKGRNSRALAALLRTCNKGSSSSSSSSRSRARLFFRP
ncbi:hypothetical protein TKK_0012662 [Trichogramma kaykai]